MLHLLIISVGAGFTGVLLDRIAPSLPDPIVWAAMVFIIGALASPVTPLSAWRRIGAALAGAVVALAIGFALG